MTNFGKGYLAFTAADGAGHDVRAAYYDGGTWALESAPLNATPADDAGTGTGAPQVAAAGDGVAIVAWGEGGHVYSRRVWGTAPSVVDEQADVPSLSGCGEVSAGEPRWRPAATPPTPTWPSEEVVSCGGVEQSRVLVNRLRASQYDGVGRGRRAVEPGSGRRGGPRGRDDRVRPGVRDLGRARPRTTSSRWSSATTARPAPCSRSTASRTARRRTRFPASPACSPT